MQINLRPALNRWPLIMAMVFSAFTVLLILSLYSAQSQLRSATNAYLVTDGKRRAAVLTDFVDERRQAVLELAGCQEIETYLLNRALGMSPQYGLNFNLDAIDLRFRNHLQQKMLRGRPIYSRIVFLDEAGGILAEAGKSERELPMPAFPKESPQLMMDTGNWLILSSAPVLFKGEFSGTVVTMSDLRLLSLLLMSGGGEEKSVAKRYQELLLTDDGVNISGTQQLPALSLAIGQSFARLPENTLASARDLPGADEFRDWLMVRSPIAGSPFSMLTLTSEIDAYGQLFAPSYILLLGAFTVALLVAAFGFERLRKRTEQLEGEYVTVDRHRAELEQHNQALSAEIARRHAAEGEINQLAYYDQLTGLPNRRLFTNRLEQSLAIHSRHRRQAALLFIDLDNFKTLNDTLGHHKGDLLLQQIAQRLIGCVREGDTVARLGGDEFVVMLEDLSEDSKEAASQAEAVGEKILKKLGQSYQLADHVHHGTASMGIALFADRQPAVEEVLQQADLAMYQAKAAGRNVLRFFDPKMQAAVTAHAAMESALREAVRKEQFLLYYQAQVDSSGRTTGAEVLLRWEHPSRGIVSPGEFIPLAEETGLILPLGQWVLDSACKQLAAWAAEQGMSHLTIAVNVSARQFHHKDFVDQVLLALHRSGADPHRLKLELTESLLVDNCGRHHPQDERAQDRRRRFLARRFRHWILVAQLPETLAAQPAEDRPEFCPGHSHRSQRCRDRQDGCRPRRKPGACSNCRRRGKTKRSATSLRKVGCHAYQGYLYGRPLPLAEFNTFAAAEHFDFVA